jgi:phage-related tail fiber protein
LTFAQAINPVGAVIWVATSTAPNGFLKANGAAVSRTTYAALFAALGTQFGAGDGSSTFNLPDLRGEFIRGWDDSRGVDSGRTFGSFQADEFKSHTHEELYNTPSSGQDQAGSGSGDNDNTSSRQTGAAGGAETRPRNVALLACIKF